MHFKTLFEHGRATGWEEGSAEGLEHGIEQGTIRVNKLYSIVIDMDRIGDLKRATQDKAYQEQLMEEMLTEKMH